jgi:hypothetical protein
VRDLIYWFWYDCPPWLAAILVLVALSTLSPTTTIKVVSERNQERKRRAGNEE